MKAAFYTLGCKVNQYESEYMAQLLEKAGFEIVSPADDADYYIINSCSVTATADQKTRKSIRKFKRNHRNSTVILTGCMPQAFPEEAKKLIEADIVFSNKNDGDILSIINEQKISGNRLIKIDEHKTGDKFGDCRIERFNERIRAFVKIEDGCDRFCSYCIIPKSRGRVRSKSLKDLEEEIALLADNGIKEIVLVGINLTAYGKGEDYDITDAVRICSDNEKIERIRLGSLEPDYITDEVINKLSKFKKLCPQFHISLQSGCDKTLKDMNRHYDSAQFKALCDKLRSTFEDAAITTDIMVGFNDESIEDFNKSLEFVKKAKFEKAHIFPYSERKGTTASRKGDSVPKSEKERRAAVMIKETDKIRNEYLQNLVGCKKEVLFESEVEDGVYQGYTRSYLPVRMKSDKNLVGQLFDVTVTALDGEFCIAE